MLSRRCVEAEAQGPHVLSQLAEGQRVALLGGAAHVLAPLLLRVSEKESKYVRPLQHACVKGTLCIGTAWVLGYEPTTSNPGVLYSRGPACEPKGAVRQAHRGYLLCAAPACRCSHRSQRPTQPALPAPSHEPLVDAGLSGLAGACLRGMVVWAI
jgi:hypothetical protein